MWMVEPRNVDGLQYTIGSSLLRHSASLDANTLITSPAIKMDLRQHYLNYISSINDGCKPGTLEPFVHDGVIHNDSPPLSIARYATNMTDAQASLPGLTFHIDNIVVEADKDGGDHGNGNMAVRIRLTFKPLPDKEEVFYEHVFYRFEDGKIRQVWSMLDGAGLKWAQARSNEAK
jgi:predicted ester cyclase